jgi:tRNA U34 5-carboxymethylaminomethyl modifying GTPase MnmE/TrmE
MREATYAEARDQLRTALAELGALADERESTELGELVRSLDKKLVENRFNVVVVGEFKRGKTTFVNALLGQPILPTAVVPLTSIVTAVTWGETARAHIRFSDGREEDVLPEELGRFVTERENPKNRLGVERAVLMFPSEELRDGVFLVDTPGVGSVYRHNTDVAREFIPEADVAIFLTSADPPISESERTFLSDVRAETVRMFFVLNKIDYLDEDESREAIAFTTHVIDEALGREETIYPLSARRAVQAKVEGDAAALEASGFAAFEREFRGALLRDKGRIVLASVAGRAAALCADEMNSIAVQTRALELPVDQLAAARERMQQVFADARRTRRDMRPLFKADTDRLVARVEQDLERLRSQAERHMRSVVAAFLSSEPDVRRGGDRLRELTEDALRAEVDRWRREEERTISEGFSTAARRFVEAADGAAREAVRLCGQILDLDLAAVPVTPDLSPETGFSYSFLELPTIVESLLPDMRRVLPDRAVRKLLEREARERIPRIVDRHCGRLRWDLVQRLERSRLALERDLEARLEATIEGLTRGIERSEADRAAGQEAAEPARVRAGTWQVRLEALREAFAAAVPAEERT